MASPSIPDISSEKPSAPPEKNRFLKKALAILGLLAAIGLLLKLDALLDGQNSLPDAGQVSYGLLFIAGLFTGFHCVGMCGALVVSYVAKGTEPGKQRVLGHFQYAAGKTLSYTVIGAIFGAVGAIVSFTPFLRGVAGISAGVFLLLFGLGMLNLIPALSRFRIKTPGSLMLSLGQAYRNNRQPFVIGLLNGLMVICGPLQAMYIMAAGTGSPVEGAKLLLVFGLGTLPLMVGFGFLAGALSKQLAPKLVKASGGIVIALGIIMLNRGLAMTGSGYDYASVAARVAANGAPPAPVTEESGHQTVRMNLNGAKVDLDHFVLRKGVPVRWIIHGDEVTSCNHRLTVPSLGLEFEVKKGENLVEFTPDKEGPVPWSCDMGMTSGSFMVKDLAPAAESSAAEPFVERIERQARELGENTRQWLRATKARLLQKPA